MAPHDGKVPGIVEKGYSNRSASSGSVLEARSAGRYEATSATAVSKAATTPNVTRIGNVFKLLVGHSNFDRLIPLDYEHPEDEWRPHFREYTLAEVCESFQRAGFQVVEARHFLGEDTRYNMKTISQQLINLAKCPFYVVPHLRGCLLAVGRKPVKGNR